MHSRAARLILLFLFFAALTTTAYLFWKGETLASSHASQAIAFDTSARAVERTLLDLRSNQRAYVAAGQSGDFWALKVAHGLETLRESLGPLGTSAHSTQAQKSIEQARASLDAFGKADGRAVEYLRRGQPQLASDVVFADGLETTEAALSALDEARAAESALRASAVDEARRRGIFAIVAGAAASVLAVLLLLPRSRSSEATVALAPAGTVSVDAVKGERVQDVATVSEATTPETAPAAIDREQEPAAFALESSVDEADVPAMETARIRFADQPSTDFVGLASLCVDLARIVDTRAMPSLLERAASLLDASGIILWIADPDGRELNPIFAQGYPQQLIDRLGTIPREAQNATAAAFRTSLLQTVAADSISEGAIAAPLVTPGGCVGVMAAEVRHDAEQQETKLAAATIVAAQLATLVGPPAAKNHVKAGSAGG